MNVTETKVTLINCGTNRTLHQHVGDIGPNLNDQVHVLAFQNESKPSRNKYSRNNLYYCVIKLKIIKSTYKIRCHEISLLRAHQRVSQYYFMLQTNCLLKRQ